MEHTSMQNCRADPRVAEALRATRRSGHGGAADGVYPWGPCVHALPGNSARRLESIAHQWSRARPQPFRLRGCRRTATRRCLAGSAVFCLGSLSSPFRNFASGPRVRSAPHGFARSCGLWAWRCDELPLEERRFGRFLVSSWPRLDQTKILETRFLFQRSYMQSNTQRITRQRQRDSFAWRVSARDL